MARMRCQCGNNLSNVVIPSDIALVVYGEPEWDEIWSVDPIASEDFPYPKHRVWRCPECERIYVFGEGGKVIKYYVLHSLDELKGES